MQIKFTCAKQEIQNAVSLVSKAIPNKHQMPLLSGLYIKAGKGMLELHGNNFEMGIIKKIAADIEIEGEILVQGKYFQDVIRILPGDDISVEYDEKENVLKISSGKTMFKLLIMAVEEYPKVREIEDGIKFIVKGDILAKLIKKTSFACAGTDGRPIFTGCLLDLEGDEIRMAATNTHRLAIEKLKYEGEPFEKNRYIIPKKVLDELYGLISGEVPENVEIVCKSNEISFRISDVFIISRLIEGQFPDYERAVPKEHTSFATISSSEFMSAINRVSLIAKSAEYNTIFMEFAGDKVKIYSDNPEIGRADEEVEISLEGNETNIAFNSDFLIDAMKIIDSEKIKISLKKPLYPIIIREEGDESFTYVLTPVRTNG